MLAQREVVAFLAASLVLSAGPENRACAQTAAASSGSDKVTAEALFEEGRSLVQAGKFGDACPKFEASQRLAPSVGTLLNLANCWEKAGRTATAWAVYKEAASAADAAGRKDYVATAQRHAEALAPKLSRLTIKVEQPVDGMQVKRDGSVVDRAEWGVGIPADAGSHSIEAAAPGHRGWATAVVVGQDGAQAVLTVPPLEPAPEQAAPAATTPAPAPLPAPLAPSTPPAPAAEHPASGTQRVVGAVVAAVGILGLGVGGVFALVAKGKYNDSLKNCLPDNPDLCSAQGVGQRDDARTFGNLATAGIGIGAATLVAGGLLWLTAPTVSAGAGGSARLVILPSLGGASLRGEW